MNCQRDRGEGTGGGGGGGGGPPPPLGLTTAIIEHDLGLYIYI